MGKLINTAKLGRLLEIAECSRDDSNVKLSCPRITNNPECELKASADKSMSSILPCNTGADYHTCSVYRVVSEGSLD